MALIEITGQVNEKGELTAHLPPGVISGKVHIIVIKEEGDGTDSQDAIWDELFANSQDILSKMSQDITAEYEAGLTEDFDPDAYVPHNPED